MPYITKYTFSKIVKEIDLSKECPPKKIKTEGRNLSILSKGEMKRLAVISELLSSEDIAVDRFFLKIKKPIDSLMYVSPERMPSYHYSKECKALSREYENYYVPEDIRRLGKISVDHFREFFNKNKEEFISNRMNFFYMVKKEFNLHRLPEDMVATKSPNSGFGAISNMSLVDLDSKLDDAILEVESYKNQSIKSRYIINMHGNKFINDLCLDNKEDESILIGWHALKNKLKSAYVFYCMVKYNPDINLSGRFLDSIGLNKCALCHSHAEEYIDVGF